MRIADLIHGLDVRIVNPGDEVSNLRVCDITEDSRTVMPGSLFIARKGEKVDGKGFVAGAIAAGAAAILTDDPGFRLGATDQERGAAAERRATQGVALLTATDTNLAIARLAERFYGEPSSKMRVIGVTGTNGKTTTTFLIHQMLNALGIRCGLIGTVVIDDGVETAAALLTTPPALEISRTFARMHDAGCQAAVMEVSSHALHQRRVGALHWNAAVFTNLTGDHLDYHKTMEEYAAAKAMLFEHLPTDGVAVVNIQDAGHSRMVKGMKSGVRVVRCKVEGSISVLGGTGSESGGTGSLLPVSGAQGTHHWQQAASATLPIVGGTAPETVCRARVMGATTEGTDVEFTGPWGHCVCRVPLVGAFNVMNALQAVATVHALWGGTDEDALSFEIIAGALEKASAPPGRLEPVTAIGAPIQVFVDYAHTDDALATVLGVLRGAMGRAASEPSEKHDLGRGTSAIGTGPMPGRVAGGELWCVFGCGGDRDRTKRPRMGKVAAEMADRVVVTSDNPRTEDAGGIIEEILAGVRAGEHGLPAQSSGRTRGTGGVVVEPDRERAIRLAITAAKPGDTIIIAGKGHEDYQILPDPAKKGATITRHFDDREVARAALRERGIAVRELAAARTDDDRDDGEDMTAGASLALGG